jgi:hypothetical protein
MKTVPLKTAKITDPAGNEREVNYADYIHAIMSSPADAGKGMTLDEIRKGLRVLNALEKGTNDSFQLEDADFEFMAARVKNSKFNFAHPTILQFVEDITTPHD